MTYIELPRHLQGLPYEEQCCIRREEVDQRRTERSWALHCSGVHVECQPMGRYGGDSPHSCKYAGRVERWHAHDFEGLLVCGCDDFSTAEGI
jgi:hypothetical protein